MKKLMIAIALMSAAGLGGCGSSSTTQTTPVTGAVADGYLQNALVFLDKNRNFQLDAGEPSTTTDQSGAYVLNVAAGELGTYPIVAVAIAGQTIDLDNPNQPVANSYVLCIPAAATSGTVSNFISPLSTLLQEKLAANPGMTLNEAMIQLRNQLNMPAGMNMLDNYMAGATTAGQFQANYQIMQRVAQQMAGLMGDQAGLVMSGTRVNVARFGSMMGQINQNLPLIVTNATLGGTNSTLLSTMSSQMQTMLSGISPTVGFGNYSAMFRNMTSHQYFWNYSGGQMTPMSGMMGGGMRM